MRSTGAAADEIRALVPDVETLARRLAGADYLVDEGLATAMFLSLTLPQPLLLEGEAGVGKTEAAKTLATVLDTPLVRLQCYEGIDAAEALYEWNYPRQLLSIRLAEARGEQLAEADLFGPDYLTERPLLRALRHLGPRPAVLLIDEIDRADDDFEAFLLELLAEATVTIPEIGTVTATHPPVIVLTSNRTRDLHDAVKRRCLYQWIDYPSAEREVAIIRRRVPQASATLAVQVATAVSRMRESDVQKPPGIAEAIDWLAALAVLGLEQLDGPAAARTLGSVLKYREDQDVVRAAGLAELVSGIAVSRAMARAFEVETVALDLPPLAGAFSRRLHDAGVPVGAERAGRFARALTLTAPVARRRLYWTARAVFVSDRGQVAAFDQVFAEVFGAPGGAGAEVAGDARLEPAASDARPDARRPRTGPPAGDEAWSAGTSPAPSRSAAPEGSERERAVATVPSDAEALRAKRFDALDADELARLYRMMSRLALATPVRRTRRHERRRHGAQVDLRRTLRASLRTGGDPVRLARRRRRDVPRRLVMLCDISGSMEPYARAYLQFLTCAAGASAGRGAGGGRNEAFAFATRLTRLTRALHSQRPERAIARAAAAAPDWSSGTRIGDALQAFNDRHGRRGMARGAVIVILSDGWERGDPRLVAREMERLARLAHRIVWVNPRVAAAGFAPRAGGMVAALPYCDALVSGHSLAALEEVAAAIASARRPDPWSSPAARPAGADPARADPAPDPDAADLAGAGAAPGTGEEPWPSATPVPGSSVAMPSGYSPSRGRTTPGWTLH